MSQDRFAFGDDVRRTALELYWESWERQLLTSEKMLVASVFPTWSERALSWLARAVWGLAELPGLAGRDVVVRSLDRAGDVFDSRMRRAQERRLTTGRWDAGAMKVARS